MAFLLRISGGNFAGSHLQQMLGDLDRNSLEQLFSVKCSLAAIDQPDLADARKCLNLVRSRIRGLDYPGASGLLALLFKEWFGTIDTCILESLWKIRSLPERMKLHEIRAWVQKEMGRRGSDAVLVIKMMRRKAARLDAAFGTNKWTPSSVSMILSTPIRSVYGSS